LGRFSILFAITTSGSEDVPHQHYVFSTTGTCYESVAAVVGVNNTNNVVVYGSNNAQDITLYAANESGMIYITGLSRHHDVRFSTAPQQHPEEYLDPTRAAALFNAARDYHDNHPNDANIVMTAGSAANGRPAVDENGRPIHQSHQRGQNIDLRYMGPNGRPLRGNTAADNADVGRTTDLLDAFANQNAELGAALTGNPARFGLDPIAERLRLIHRNHMHLQRNYPRVPQPGRRR